MSAFEEVSLDFNDEPVSVHNPLPTDGDSEYVKDLDLAYCDNGNFSGSVSDYFDSLKTVRTDTTTDNPKTIKVWFKRTIYAHAIGFGCDDLGNSFGSDMTIHLLGSGEVERFTKNFTGHDGNSFLAEFGPKAFNGFIVHFNTASTVCLSNITIQKSLEAKSTIHGVNPEGDINEVGITKKGQFKVSIEEYGDTPAVDAFARLRISAPYTLFDSKQLHDKQPLFWDERLGGAATSIHNPVNAETRMSVTASASDYVIRQTKQRFNYQPGKSQFIFMTFHSPQATGITSRIGYFDGTGANYLTPNNGVFFECDGALSWNIAKNGTTTETVTQANWNVDKLDGTGESGITLDMNAPQILCMDLEWLGVGRVRVGFVIDGLIYYVHYFNHANNPSFDSVYMSTPNLPLRYSIETDGTSPSHIDHICSTVMSEGGLEKTGVLRGVDTGSTHLNANAIGTTYAVLAVRRRSGFNDVTVFPERISIISETQDDFRWSVHLNPTIDGALSYTALTNSSLEYAAGATTNDITDEGVVVGSGFASVTARGDSSDLNTALLQGSTIDGVEDILVLAVTPLSSNADIQGSVTMRELL